MHPLEGPSLGLHSPPLTVNRALGRGLALVEVGEVARPGLVAGGDFVLLAGFLDAVPGIVRQFGHVVAVRQLRLQLQGGGEAVGGKARRTLPPRDFAYVRLHTVGTMAR